MGRRHGSGLTELKCLIATTVSVCPGPIRSKGPTVSTLGAVMKVRMTATTGTIEYNATTQTPDIFARNLENPVAAIVQNQTPI